MTLRPKHISRIAAALLLPLAAACSGPLIQRPCKDGGQPARDDGKVGKGNKQCEQIRANNGSYVNHGRYIEWYPGGKRALEGEYTGGVKTGKWTEWDEQGKKIGEKWYEGGAELPGRETQPYNGLTPQPRQAPQPSRSAAPSSASTSP